MKFDRFALIALVLLLLGAAGWMQKSLGLAAEESKLERGDAEPARETNIRAEAGRHPVPASVSARVRSGAGKRRVPDSSSTQVVIVVDSRREPVKGARVTPCGARSGGGFFMLDDHHAGEMRVHRTEGAVEVVTDEWGRATVGDVPPEGRPFVAEFDGQMGVTHVYPPGSDHFEGREPGAAIQRIELQACRRFHFEVRDEKDRPVADAILVLDNPDASLPLGRDWEGWGGASLHDIKTDAKGSAQFIATPTQTGDLHGAKRLRVSVMRFGGDPFQKTFRIDKNREHFRLRIPETVAVTFQLEEADGKTLRAPTKLYWSSDPAVPLEGRNSLSFRRDQGERSLLSSLRTWRLVLGPGGGRLRAFAPNASLNTIVTRKGLEDRRDSLQLSGMANQTLTLSAGQPQVTIRLRVVDERGEASKISHLAYCLVDRKGFSRFLYFESRGKDGTRDALVSAGTEGTLHVLERNCYQNWKVESTELDAAPYRLAIKAQSPGAVIDLGRIEFERPPLLLSGRVVGESGRPVAGVYLKLVPEKALDLQGVGQRDSYGLETETDDQGRFEVRMTSFQDHHFRVMAQYEWSGKSETFAAGSENIKLVVRRRSAIRGIIKAFAATDPDQWKVFVHDPEAKRYLKKALPDARGRFWFGGLAAGRYEIVVMRQNEEWCRSEIFTLATGALEYVRVGRP